MLTYLQTVANVIAVTCQHTNKSNRTATVVYIHTVVVLIYLNTSSTTSTLRLPLYILSAVRAYQKRTDTGQRVMLIIMLMLQGVLKYRYCVSLL